MRKLRTENLKNKDDTYSVFGQTKLLTKRHMMGQVMHRSTKMW